MVLMAYAPSGTLQDALDANKFQAAVEVVRLLGGVARGMAAVHAHNIIHLDLKPENVLIGPYDVPWITDFGLSTSANMTSMSQSSAGGRGTLPFKAPELFAHPPVVSKAADVYAFSILAWIVVTGEQPYLTMEFAATALPSAVASGTRPELSTADDDWRDRTTSTLAKLIESMWVGDKSLRPVFDDEPGSMYPSAEPGIVGRLERIESATAKMSDDASQESFLTRLIAAEAEAEEAEVYLARIEDACADASTTAGIRRSNRMITRRMSSRT